MLRPQIFIYRHPDSGKWHWNLVAKNGKVIAEGGGLSSRFIANEAAMGVCVALQKTAEWQRREERLKTKS